jgi:hypothetical protein
LIYIGFTRVVRMVVCEWCEEEVESGVNAIVAGFDKHLCKTCHGLYLDGHMDEFVNRRPTWNDS